MSDAPEIPQLPLDPPDGGADSMREPPPPRGEHLTTVSHEGRFWDVYVEFDEDPRRSDSYGGILCFSRADEGDGPVILRTATILIEPSYEELLHRARHFETHHLVALLRSCLPED